MVDMSDFRGIMKRSLTIPLDFVPYMEKHKLYEFFYELVTQLLIQQPEDPIVFMKQCVQHAIRKRDIPRVILIAPPNFDKMTLAKILQDETGVCPVTLDDLRALASAKNACLYYDANEIAIRMKEILMSGVLHNSGWTLVDIPRNKKEARALQRVGVIPTHEVEADSRTMQQLGRDCAALTKIPKHYGAPSLFRIVLIGPPGSGYHSLAKDISERFNLICVNFNYILRQACLQETALDEMRRLCEQRCEQQLKPEIRIEIVKQFVLRSECLKTGWILTGYPKTVEDFKLLDMIPTPPNRVIILEVDIETCRERLLNRRHNTDESEHDFTSTDSFKIDLDYELNFHSENHRNVIEQNLREYKENIESILQYTRNTASVMDATGKRTLVRERLEACLMRPAPSVKSRIPEPLLTTEPMDIEFDPNDEPDPSIFDDIRVPEPKYSFI
ncbi:Adenylate kinase [Ooceraea biroi]|uniref:Adenylate kinase n=1 Tax=Ooceraea biroi TaxID=2015173 RepID=A0A026VVQ7_OOCBI|nr:Adenylate kinase [Ooceraea biroi]